MSILRPTLHESDEPGLDYNQTYFRVFEATGAVRSLIHGKLDTHDGTCAVGAYFRQASTPINSKAIDEIAAYNDSFPKLTQHKRWTRVRKWLKFKLSKLK